MVESILNGKKILAVDDEPEILEVLEEKILGTCPKCQFSKATSYETAVNMLKSENDDLVILDIKGVQGFDFLAIAVSRNLPVAMLTAHSLKPESLKRSIEMKARAYLPKDKLGEIVPFLEGIFKETEFLLVWAGLMKKLDAYLISNWGEKWQKNDTKFWKEFFKLT